MKKEIRVPVYEPVCTIDNPDYCCYHTSIAPARFTGSRVRLNTNLDTWKNGRWQWQKGVGYHLGLTRLRDGRYVLILSSDWEGEKPIAYVVPPEIALEYILYSGHLELLQKKKFKELKKNMQK